MSQWLDPKLAVSAALIGLFAFAYINNPADETMKGAVILAFATAYGYWLGSNKTDSQRSDNTSKAFDTVKAALDASPGTQVDSALGDASAIREGDSVTISKE